MAIKGKKRTRSRRPKPAAPKQSVVVPKKRFLSRRWVQVTAASLMALAVGLGFGYGFGKQSETTRKGAVRAKEREAATEYRDKVDAALKGVGSPDPATGEFVVLSDLSSGIEGLKGGGSDGAASRTAAESASKAKAAAKEIDQVDLTKLVETDTSLPAAFTAPLFESQGDMAKGLELYQQAALNLKRAVQNDGTARSGFISAARKLSELGAAFFADGYEDYVAAQIEAGVYTPPVNPQQQLQQQLQQQVDQQGSGSIPPGQLPSLPASAP